MILTSCLCIICHSDAERTVFCVTKLGSAQAIHIGDNLVTDIQGGNGAGLKATIWVDRQNIGIPEGVELRSRPTFVVHHVTDLVKLMPQLKL